MPLCCSSSSSRNKNVPRRNSPVSEWSRIKSLKTSFLVLDFRPLFPLKRLFFLVQWFPLTLRKLYTEQQTLESLLEGGGQVLPKPTLFIERACLPRKTSLRSHSSGGYEVLTPGGLPTTTMAFRSSNFPFEIFLLMGVLKGQKGKSQPAWALQQLSVQGGAKGGRADFRLKDTQETNDPR